MTPQEIFTDGDCVASITTKLHTLDHTVIGCGGHLMTRIPPITQKLIVY
jgi:hypothetical protein